MNLERRRFLAGLLVGTLIGFILGFPVAFSTIAYLKHQVDMGRGTRYMPPLSSPTLGSRWGAPDLDFGLRIEDESGRVTTLDPFRGKVIFVNLWATWCGPCLREMSSLAALYRQLGDDPRFAFVSIAKDDSSTELRSFLAREKLPYPVYRLPEGSEIKGTGTAVPVTLVADRDGRILTRVMGVADWSDPKFVGELRALLSQ